MNVQFTQHKHIIINKVVANQFYRQITSCGSVIIDLCVFYKQKSGRIRVKVKEKLFSEEQINIFCCTKLNNFKG